eukprot:scaffold33749_cov34-Cyclotella_meneghiniana.AAC.1
MDYPELPMPRENDRCIMTLAIQMKYRGDDLRSVNRCRISSCSIFLSDLVAANGRTLDQTRGLQDVNYASSTTYDFPTEHPSQRDWEVWRVFWSSYCLPDGSLPCSLGKWKNTTHRQWEWFYSESTDILIQCSDGVNWRYRQCPVLILVWPEISII